MIIKDKTKLQEKCSPVSVKEGEEIGVRLLHELRESENGIGLAANQRLQLGVMISISMDSPKKMNTLRKSCHRQKQSLAD